MPTSCDRGSAIVARDFGSEGGRSLNECQQEAFLLVELPTSPQTVHLAVVKRDALTEPRAWSRTKANTGDRSRPKMGGTVDLKRLRYGSQTVTNGRTSGLPWTPGNHESNIRATAGIRCMLKPQKS